MGSFHPDFFTRKVQSAPIAIAPLLADVIPPTGTPWEFLAYIVCAMGMAIAASMAWYAKSILIPERDRRFVFLDKIETSIDAITKYAAASAVGVDAASKAAAAASTAASAAAAGVTAASTAASAAAAGVTSAATAATAAAAGVTAAAKSAGELSAELSRNTALLLEIKSLVTPTGRPELKGRKR